MCRYVLVSTRMCRYVQVCVSMCSSLKECWIYTVLSSVLSAWMAQWYIVSSVHLKTGVRAPEGSKAFCCDLFDFLSIYFNAQRPHQEMPPLLCWAGNMYKIPAHTYTYKHIHADTCTYLQINTEYMQIPTYCMYVHVYLGIACMT
jgi:hypothetical protein